MGINEDALMRLQTYVEKQSYSGYDPYDALKSPLLRRLGNVGAIVSIQINKRSPINLRPAIRVPKGLNPKGMGLFLHAYSVLAESEAGEGYLVRARSLFEWLLANQSSGYAGASWGYDFDWASPEKYLPARTPSAVVTAFVAQGVHAYFLASGDDRARDLLVNAARFVLEELPRTEQESGVCFSYTPIKKDCCYNASLLAAETLARAASVIGGEGNYEALAESAVSFAVAKQHSDGHWNYSMNLTSGTERHQVDFHQGFVLDSVQTILSLTGRWAPAHESAWLRGLEFYRANQFTADGRALWRLPRRWPTDIHHQAQGILTFTRASKRDPSSIRVAERIADWTITHMQSARGYFCYQKWPGFVNRMNYMRWGQAWMFLALATLQISKRRS